MIKNNTLIGVVVILVIVVLAAWYVSKQPGKNALTPSAQTTQTSGSTESTPSGSAPKTGSQTAPTKAASTSAYVFFGTNKTVAAGTAILGETSGKANLELTINNGVLPRISVSEPAQIHAGTCAKVGALKYTLNTVVNGHSQTTMDVSIATLKAQMPFVITVYESAGRMGTPIACADVK